ncbi:MAG: 50S ribosomal protein L1, partial [Actinomycetota bacterium]
SLAEAGPRGKTIKFSTCDETLEEHRRLGVDPKPAAPRVRGTVVLPHGLGKTKRILVIASGDKVREAQEAGADFFGGEELVNKIMTEQWLDYDAVIATPDMMRSVGKLGKVLGPRGLMPNPKTGTVTTDVTRAVAEFKGGKVEYRTDRYGNVHIPVGKVSFEAAALAMNVTAVLDELNRTRPAAAKGRYIKKISLSSTMGPGVKIDPALVSGE